MIPLTTRLDLARECCTESVPRGTVTDLAARFAVSRTTVYEVAQEVQEIFDPRFRRSLRAEIRRLHRELKKREADRAWLQAELDRLRRDATVTEEQIERLILITAVCPVSCANIPQILYAVYGVRRSKSYVWSVIQRHGAKARRLFDFLKPYVRCERAAADEIFQGRRPTLVAVEPGSLAIVRLQVADDRSADTWAQFLQPCELLGLLAADRALGIEGAVDQLKWLKQDDLWHAQREMGKGLRKWEADCFAQIALEYELLEEYQHLCRRLGPQDRQVAQAWISYVDHLDRVQLLLERFDEGERRIRAMYELLSVCGAPGRFLGAAQRAARMAQHVEALKALGLPRWRKIQGYFRSPNLLTFVRQIEKAFAGLQVQAGLLSGEEILQAAVGEWDLAHRRTGRRDPLARLRLAVALRRVAAFRDCANFPEVRRQVHGALGRALRGSSAVEMINSLLRPIQQVKKTFPTDFAYLVALHQNMRPFREGLRKGKTPLELLGVSVPTADWTELLRRVPEDPRQPIAL